MHTHTSCWGTAAHTAGERGCTALGNQRAAISARKVCSARSSSRAGLRTCCFFLSVNAVFCHLLIDLSIFIHALQWVAARAWKDLSFWHLGRCALALRSSMPDFKSCKLPSPASSSSPIPALPLIATHYAGPRSFTIPHSSARSIRGAGGEQRGSRSSRSSRCAALGAPPGRAVLCRATSPPLSPAPAALSAASVRRSVPSNK